MPSKLPTINFHTEKEIIDKMKFIAKQNNRSLSKEVEYRCKQTIATYEAEHGKIVVEEEESHA